MKNVFEIMFRWCLTYDAVYTNSSGDISIIEKQSGKRSQNDKTNHTKNDFCITDADFNISDYTPISAIVMTRGYPIGPN